VFNNHSRLVKQAIKKTSLEAYLLYTIFEIFAYINIHYHKQITHGFFEFMKVGHNYFLANVRKLTINEDQILQREYMRENLFDDFQEEPLFADHDSQEPKSGVVRALEQLLDQEHTKLCSKVRTFVELKLETVQNNADVTESNNIFRSINEKCKYNLHDLFRNEREYYKFLKKKENELDGLSPLTSISTISRKNHSMMTSGRVCSHEK
jgi:hypothetical protein